MGKANALLGRKAVDKITGFEGIVTGRAEYISGCDQVLIVPPVDEKGGFREGQWFDLQRVSFSARALTLDNSKTPGPDHRPPER